LLLVRRTAVTGIARTAVFLPSVLPPVAAALAFGWLLKPGQGPLDHLLGALHLPQPLWFSDPQWAKPGLVLLGLWGAGPVMILYIGGLVRVPRVLYEAAALEGAGRCRQFRRITLPMLAPVLLFTVITGVVGALQYFTEAYVASQDLAGQGLSGLTGSPEGSTRFYSTWMFEQGFGLFHLGYASMLATVLFVVSFALVTVLLVATRRAATLEARA
jgi:multiple sugar transport system permease protein